MRETLDCFLVERYLGQLERELAIYGISQPQRGEMLAEARAHLEQAIAHHDPQSGEELEAIIKRFGGARSLARAQAANDARPKHSRYLWPLTVLVFLQFPIFWLPSLSIFGSRIWSGTIVLSAAFLALAIMGFRARRPLFGQFAAFAGVSCLFWTVWYLASSYPVAAFNGQDVNYYSTVRRPALNEYVARESEYKTRHQQIAEAMVLGKARYAQKDQALIPASLRGGQGYWLPEGAREVLLGIPPTEINAHCSTSSFEVAYKEWVSDKSKGETEADWILQRSPGEIQNLERSIEFAGWIKDQPLSTQAGIDLKIALQRTVPFALVGLISANAGWLLWLLYRGLSRLMRRLARRAGDWAVR